MINRFTQALGFYVSIARKIDKQSVVRSARGGALVQNVRIARATLPSGKKFLIAKVPAGSVLTAGAAQRVINALRVILPPEDLILEIAVTDDGPTKTERIFAVSHDAEAYIRKKHAKTGAAYVAPS